MKTKLNLKTTLVVIVALAALVGVGYISTNYFSKKAGMAAREKYENFLRNEAKNLSPDWGKEDKKEAMDNPEMAAFRDYYMTLDPSLKQVPQHRKLLAYQKTVELQKQLRLSNIGKEVEWENVPCDMGGRSRCLIYDPNDNTGNKVWAGSVTGGLWFNNNITDQNQAWQPVNDFWDNLVVSCIAYDPNNTQNFYVGTGEAHTAVTIYRESSGRGIGLWKSTNGGSTWALLPSTADFAYINDIVVRNENGTSVIYIAVVSGLYHEGNHQSLPSDGLYRSTDQGESWEQVLPNIAGTNKPYAPSDIELAANGKFFVGTMKNLDKQGGACILMSETGTSGSWTVYDDYVSIIENDLNYNVPGRVVLSSAPSNPDIVYAIIASGFYTTNGWNYSYGNYIIRTENSGQTWVERAIPPTIEGRHWAYLAWHALVISVSPTDPNKVFIGGLDVHTSNNGGQDWQIISDWTGMYGGGTNYVHADQHAQVFKKNQASEMLFTTDGGIFYTAEANSTHPVYGQRNRNFNTLQFYTCDIHDEYDYFVGGLQDNGTLLYTDEDPLNLNSMISGGDGAYCFFDENDNWLITSVYYNAYYIMRNNEFIGYQDYESGVFINPADYDPQANIIYANAASAYFQNLDQIIRIELQDDGYNVYLQEETINLATGSNVPYSHIKISPYNGNTVFVGSQAGRLFKITNAQTNPQVSEIGSTEFPTAYISCVAVGESDSELLVTFSNYGVESVWYTANGGSTWVEKEANLPDMPIRWAIFHPENHAQVMLATEIGVWTTFDLQSENLRWIPSTNGMPNVRVDMLKIRNVDNKVLAATHGRGLFYGDFPVEALQAPVANFQANNVIVAVGEQVQFTDLSEGAPTSWLWNFEGAEPASSTLQNPVVVYNTVGNFSVSLTVFNEVGDNTKTLNNFITVQLTGIENKQIECEVFPNPASNYLQVKISANNKGNKVLIYNEKGALAHSEKLETNSQRIDIEKLPSGMYIVEIIDSKNNILYKTKIVK